MIVNAALILTTTSTLTLVPAGTVVALAVNSELRDIRSCTIMFGKTEGRGWALLAVGKGVGGRGRWVE